MARNHPCRACRKRQKGCIWKRNSNVCLLCSKLKVECTPADESSDDDQDILPREYNIKTLEYYHYQITQLENELQRMECDLVRCQDKQRKLENIEWKLSIEQGQLKLHTAIRNFEELIMFSQASLRYLAPFENIIKTTLFRFENRALTTITQTVCRVFSQAMTQRLLKGQILYSSPKSMPYTLPQIRKIMDDLIRLHLRHNNRKMPLLHAPTFLQQYNNLADPFSSPLVLAICVNTICTYRGLQKRYSAVERRQLGEFFCHRCKELLADTFDDPDRKLETIFTITFLIHFITFVLLKPRESRRFVTIAYLLCKELESDFSEIKEPTVMSVLFQRHYFFIQRAARLVNHVIDGTIPPVPFPSIQVFEKIPDEDEVTCMYIDVYNHILGFFQKPFVKNVISFADNPATDISLEMIFHCDRAIHEWYDELPPQLRLCEDFNAEDTQDAVMKNTSQAAALVFAFVHYNMLRVYVCLVNPKPLSPDDVVQNSKDAIQMLSEKAISQVLRSCDLVLSTLLRIINHFKEDIPPLTFELMSRVIHGLVTVASCSSTKIPSSLQCKFFECTHAIHALMPSDNKIPPALSPLKAFMETRQQGDLQVYTQYPLPGAALILDLFNMFCADLQSHLGRNQMGTVSTFNYSFINAVLCAEFPVRS
ncbi:hypothetical protein BJV82DRAFT_620770 [Fennellomyces sp. T-0311]|nr:hypothetical protein BJV82DRAFT_620770 [Fennellomyces sp. T-0311]